MKHVANLGNFRIATRWNSRELHRGRQIVATIEPDKVWPKMWRVRLPNGWLSDMANLTRAKDAAVGRHDPELRRPGELHAGAGKEGRACFGRSRFDVGD